MAYNKKLFVACSHLFCCASPETYQAYKNVDRPLKVGVWTTCAINFNWGAMEPHKDKDDYRHGFCYVLPFERDDLYFPKLNITIKMRSGIVVAFKLAELLHEVLSFLPPNREFDSFRDLSNNSLDRTIPLFYATITYLQILYDCPLPPLFLALSLLWG
jgi:hypothetical protein